MTGPTRSPVLSLPFRGVQKPRVPCEWRADSAPVHQGHGDFVLGEVDLRHSFTSANRQITDNACNTADGLLSHSKQTFDRYVLVDILPMDANSFSNKPPVLLLSTCSGPKPRKPFERSRNFTSVREDNVQGVWRERNIHRQRLNSYV